jgi:hypothetical protein
MVLAASKGQKHEQILLGQAASASPGKFPVLESLALCSASKPCVGKGNPVCFKVQADRTPLYTQNGGR